MADPRARRLARSLAPVGTAIAAVGAATGLVALLEHGLGVPNAAAVYLVAVSAVAIAVGTGGAVLAALLAVLVYDFLFTNPLHTLSVADPGELLHLLLLLFVAVTVGQLASLQRSRAEVAEAREREARALVDVSRLLANRDDAEEVLPAIAAVLAREPGTSRAWISLGADDATERTVADTGAGEAPRRSGAYAVLHRQAGRLPPTWTQIRGAGGPADQRDGRYRVRIESAGRVLGSIWGLRAAGSGMPSVATTSLLAVTAEQIAQALEHDRLAAESRAAEIARQSDALKSALLDSVSHDLRTPLASIRMYAGTLMDEEVQLTPDEARASAAAIDREAQRLNRIVTNLLDLSRIEGGALRARHESLELDEAVQRAIRQVRGRLGGREVRAEVPPELAVDGDPVLLDEALVNLLENAAAHTPDGTLVVVSAALGAGDRVRLTVEDAGPGVPREALPYLFEKFFQVRAPGVPADRGADRRRGASGRRRQGTGIGLAVVRGMAEALGGTARARISQLGGLAVDLELRAAAATGRETE